MNKTICDKFLALKTINPRTGRKIMSSGKVYKDLMKECSPSSKAPPKKIQPKKSSPKMSVCEEFMKNKTKNPRTGRVIKENGPVYTKLLKECVKEMALVLTPNELVVKKYIKDATEFQIKEISSKWFGAVNTCTFKNSILKVFRQERIKLLKQKISIGFGKISKKVVNDETLLKLFFILYNTEINDLFGEYIGTLITVAVFDNEN